VLIYILSVLTVWPLFLHLVAGILFTLPLVCVCYVWRHPILIIECTMLCVVCLYCVKNTPTPDPHPQVIDARDLTKRGSAPPGPPRHCVELICSCFTKVAFSVNNVTLVFYNLYHNCNPITALTVCFVWKFRCISFAVPTVFSPGAFYIWLVALFLLMFAHYFFMVHAWWGFQISRNMSYVTPKKKFSPLLLSFYSILCKWKSIESDRNFHKNFTQSRINTLESRVVASSLSCIAAHWSHSPHECQPPLRPEIDFIISCPIPEDAILCSWFFIYWTQ